jgi:putative Mg2+ transporter-C (MgtC) family protein
MTASGERSPWTNALLIGAAAVAALGAILVLAACVERGSCHPSVIVAELRPYGVMLWRLALAMLLAVIIGADRERHDKPAGLRTIAMVGVGGCLFGLLATMAFVGDASSRVVQGLVTGVGFLGAGTIIKERSRIEGLTTAATIWTVSGIGLAAGMGWYALAVMAATAVVFVLTVLRHFEARHRKAAGEPSAINSVED